MKNEQGSHDSPVSENVRT